MPSNSKKSLRLKFKQIRDEIAKKQKNEFDNRIFQNLVNHLKNKENLAIGSYMNFGSEPNTLKLHNILNELQHSILIPTIKNRELVFSKISNETNFIKNKYGISEPQKLDNPKAPNVIITPALAIDKHGTRLGYGGGFYDLYFEKFKKVEKIALIYECQLSEKPLPKEAHDQPIDLIITERQIIKTKRQN